MDVLILAPSVIGFVVVVILLSALFQTRCPRCGGFFAAKVTGEQKIAEAVTEDQVFDDKTMSYRTMRTHHKGYLVSHVCKRCEHRWERIRSTSRGKKI